ncbi:alpha/beta-Hydrolases superfamily protein [Rhynchospora pubera]|uniref:Alpha/beta-Hydrolases superfamily protein n=1 Tax=Rhynchospora pubera TaxID=906938 RepID=A0AAV8C5I6_9POAL|nr:alpha/beta-Hydrolases superfamily protein [Rhynchospora pubera]KAJ4750409.1 alpha/beta-Hydrolases superfamily protein [Rhynchospora pubera]KAJ4820446.1 alpha/beta-Hydrolases superfamily protein [Rhynchospora pubera]
MGFSIASLMNSMFRRSFVSAGLLSDNISVDSDTTIHCWISASLPVSNESKKPDSNTKPVLLLIPGFGTHAIWHWNAQVGPMSRHFDIIVPDLIFFGGSTTSSSLRSEVFQAEVFTRLLDVLGVADRDIYIAGTSYGGFVAYHMAQSLGPERVKKVVIASSDLLKSEEDDKELMKRGGVDNLVDLLVPKYTKTLKSLLGLTTYRAPKFMPEFLLKDIMRYHFKEYTEQKLELINGLVLDTKDFELTPLQQDVLVVWGEGDQIFPVDKAYKVKEKLGDKARLEVLPKTGHIPHQEDSKRFNKLLLNFLSDTSKP